MAFIAYFGIYHRFSANPNLEGHRFRAFDLPILIFVLISFGVGFDLIRDLHIPLISFAERVPARFLIMPLVALVMISSIRMEPFLATIDRNTTFKLLSLAAVVLLAYQLASHSLSWKIGMSAPAAEVVSDFTFNRAGQVDLLYTTAVNVGGLLTLIVIVGIAAFSLWTVAAKRTAGDRDRNVGSG